MKHRSIWHQEGQAHFQTNDAFFNPNSKHVRDLGVLAVAVEAQERSGIRVIDAFASSGVRSLRYVLEGGADYVWSNEGNPQLRELLQQNLSSALSSERYQITHQDAHRVFFGCYLERDYYDLIDVDCFGSSASYLQSMLWATKIGGLMYLTCTDGRTITGHPPSRTVQTYNAIARSHPALQEQALRILLGATQQQAATKKLGIEPIFSLFTGQTYRLMLRLCSKPKLNATNYGFLSYCHNCGNYQTITWQKLNQIACSCPNPGLTVSGAMWLGRLHHPQYLERYRDLAQTWGWHKIVQLLELMQNEVELPPYYYHLGEIGRRGKLDIPKKAVLLAKLQEQGYRATATSLDTQGIKTDATMETCIQSALAG